jgi:hypothetical protein
VCLCAFDEERVEGSQDREKVAQKYLSLLKNRPMVGGNSAAEMRSQHFLILSQDLGRRKTILSPNFYGVRAGDCF